MKHQFEIDDNATKCTSLKKTPSSLWLCDAFISLSVFALFFGTPLFFLGNTLQGVFFEKQLWMYFWLFVGIAAYAISGITSGTFRIRRTPLDIPILGVWLVGLLTLLFSVDMWRSFVGAFIDPSRGFLALTAYVLAYFFLVSSATPTRIRLMLGGVLASGFLILLLSLIRIFAIVPLPEWVPIGTMGSITSLGVFLSALLSLLVGSLFLLGERKGIIWRGVSVMVFVAILFLLLALLAISDYILWSALLIGMGIMVLFLFSRVVRPNRWGWAATFVFVSILVMLMIANNVSIARVTLPGEIFSDARLSWDIAKSVISEHSFFGVGPALYEYAFSRYTPEGFFANSFFQIRPMYTQGLFLELLATTGIVGVLAFSMLLLWAFGFGMYTLSRSAARNKILSLTIWSSTIVLWLGCLFSVCHGSLLLVAVLMGIFAVITILSDGDIEEKWLSFSMTASPRFAILLSLISLGLMIGAAFALVFFGRMFTADVYAGIGMQRELSIAPNGSVSYFSRAATLSPGEGHYVIRLSREFLALANMEATKSEGERDRNALLGFLQDARFLAERARSLMPASVLAQENVAIVYDGLALFNTSMLDNARREYERLLEMTNGNPEVYVKLGQLNMAEARRIENTDDRRKTLERAREKFQRAADMNRQYTEARYRWALAEDALGNLDEAIRILEDVVAIAGETGNVAYTFSLAQAYSARNGEGDVRNAEELFRRILGVNDKEINTLLNLGLLYERTGKRNEAITSYEKVLDALPEEGSDAAKEQIETFIRTLRSGGNNFSTSNRTVSENVVLEEIIEESEEGELEEELISDEGEDEESRADSNENR
jgi:tetratricopeptide (TPR) repeat protein